MSQALPDSFKHLFWSENFSELDADADKRKIIVNTINYGELEHWRWISETYGKDQVAQLLSELPVTELRERVRPLAKILFEVLSFNHAPRGSHS